MFLEKYGNEFLFNRNSLYQMRVITIDGFL